MAKNLLAGIKGVCCSVLLVLAILTLSPTLHSKIVLTVEDYVLKASIWKALDKKSRAISEPAFDVENYNPHNDTARS